MSQVIYNNGMARGYRDIKAVHESDLRGFLANIGLLEDFEAGKAKCKFCGDVVTMDNIYSVIKVADKHRLVCSKATCVSELMAYLETQQKNGTKNG